MTFDDEYKIETPAETGVVVYPDITDEAADMIRKRASVHRGAAYMEEELWPPGGSSHGDEIDDVLGATMEDLLNTDALYHEEPIVVGGKLVFADELVDMTAGEVADLIEEEPVISFPAATYELPVVTDEVFGASAYDRGLDVIGAGSASTKKAGAATATQGRKPPPRTIATRPGGTTTRTTTTKPPAGIKAAAGRAAGKALGIKTLWSGKRARPFESRFKVLKDISGLGAKAAQRAITVGQRAQKSKNPKAQAAGKKAIAAGQKALATAKKLDTLAVAKKASGQRFARGKARTSVRGFDILGWIGSVVVGAAPPDDTVYQTVPATGNDYFPDGGLVYDGTKGLPRFGLASASVFQLNHRKLPPWPANVPPSGEPGLTENGDPIGMYSHDGKTWVKWIYYVDEKTGTKGYRGVPVEDSVVLESEPLGPNNAWGPLVGDPMGPKSAPWLGGLRYAYQDGVWWWPKSEAPDWAIRQADELDANERALLTQVEDATTAADATEEEERQKTWAKEDTLFERQAEVESRTQALADAKAEAEIERTLALQTAQEMAAENPGGEMDPTMLLQLLLQQGAAAPASDSSDPALQDMLLDMLLSQQGGAAGGEVFATAATDPARAAQALQEEAQADFTDVVHDEAAAASDLDAEADDALAIADYGESLIDPFI